MGTLAVLPSALPPLPGPVVTVATPSGLIFMVIAADGIPAIDVDVLPADLSDRAVNDLCEIAQATRAALAVWAAKHTVPTLREGA